MGSKEDSPPRCQLDFLALRDLFSTSSMYRGRDHCWAAIVGTVLLGFGQEKYINDLCDALLSDFTHSSATETERLSSLRNLREALLKASPLVGFPRSINGLTMLRRRLQSSAPDLEAQLSQDQSLRAAVPLQQRQARGHAFFSKIYSQHTERVLQDLNACSGGDLGEFAINCVYGDLVAETAILGPSQTGLLEFVACVCLAVAPQAKGHMYGAKNLGNSGEDIRVAISVVKRVAEDLHLTAWSATDMDPFLEKANAW